MPCDFQHHLKHLLLVEGVAVVVGEVEELYLKHAGAALAGLGVLLLHAEDANDEDLGQVVEGVVEVNDALVSENEYVSYWLLEPYDQGL